MTVKFANANSLWYARLDDAAPLLNDGSDSTAKLVRQIRYTTHTVPKGFYDAPFETHVNQDSFSSPIWVVPADYPTTKVQWITNSGNGPPATPTQAAGLQTLLDHVPLPLDAGLQLFSNGSDGACVVWQPSTDTLWEFWKFKKNYTNPYNGITYPWSCAYAGVMLNATQSRGIFPNNWGSSATSATISCGTIQLGELANGVINHAVRVALPVTAPGHYAPATRNDSATHTQAQANQPVLTTLAAAASAGDTSVALAAVPDGYLDNRLWRLDNATAASEAVTITQLDTGTGVATLSRGLTFAHTSGANVQIANNTDAVKEGALFRFPAGMTIPTGLDPFAAMLMTAIRDYGVIVDDGSGVVSWYVESTFTLGTTFQMNGLASNPLPGTYTGSTPSTSIMNIPWESLQQIQYVAKTLAPPMPLLNKLARRGGVPILLKPHPA